MAGRIECAWPEEAGLVTGPLRGVKILDLTTVIMGPFATQILADMGADVIKVESPGGDSMRYVGPWRHAGMGPLFLQANRNKRSVLLDLKSPEGKARALALATRADVLVSNVRPQGLARLGLDYESVRSVNPALLYCSAVGYGEGGPDSGKAVYDDLMQAASGISGLFRKIDGAPRYAPVNVCDRTVGLYLANAITAGLYHRERTGEGQFVEVPMFETMAQFVLADHMGGEAFEPPVGPMSYGRLLSTTRGPYATKDGHLAVVVYVDRHWRVFSAMVGDPELLDRDARFRTMENRTQNAQEIGAYLARHLAARTNAEWLHAPRRGRHSRLPRQRGGRSLRRSASQGRGLVRTGRTPDRGNAHRVALSRPLLENAGVDPASGRPIWASITRKFLAGPFQRKRGSDRCQAAPARIASSSQTCVSMLDGLVACAPEAAAWVRRWSRDRPRRSIETKRKES